MPDWTLWLSSIVSVLAVCQLIIWLNNKVFGPRRKLAMQEHQSMLGLKDFGFAPITDAYVADGEERQAAQSVAYLGQIDGYWVEVAFDWRTGWIAHPHFRIKAFYGLTGTQQSVETILAQSPRFRWAPKDILLVANCAETKVLLGKYSVPATQTLLQAGSYLTNEFKRIGLVPIGYKAAVSLIEQREAIQPEQ